MAFKDNIRDERIKRNWTQIRAAKEIGISVNNLNQYEMGTAHPRWPLLKKIIDKYGISSERIYKFLFQ